MGGGRPAHVEFEKPLREMRSTVLRNGEQLVFGRVFEGRREDRTYFEIAQTLAHAHGLHWVPERRAWCRFDDNGDVEDVIRWTHKEGRGGYDTANCVSIRRDVIEMHMSARAMAIVQMFDSSCIQKGFRGWDKGEFKTIADERVNLYYRGRVQGEEGSVFRGVQIIKPKRTSEEFAGDLVQRDAAPKMYESFLTLDWKNKRLATVSCDPAHLASYFDKGSPLPFETSPVFFNASVLERYKADPEKYTLDRRSITCRNAWHLATYDVNEPGQVHTYIKYLGDLPHSEQVYWRAFNEPPKGGISERAFKTDFEGEPVAPDALDALRMVIEELHSANLQWFRLREPELIKQMHYPLTASTKTWGDVITILAKLVIEGLDKRFFEARALANGAIGDPNWRSIRWMQESLVSGGTSDDVVSEVVTPLRELQNLRTKLGPAHSGGAEANTVRALLLREHGNPREHTEHLCKQLVNSLRRLRLLTQ
jgi:hypothetical protein